MTKRKTKVATQRSRPARQSTTTSSASLASKRWLIGLAMLGVALLTMRVFHQQYSSPTTDTHTQIDTHHVKSESDDEPVFEFYTRLPQEHGGFSQNATKHSTSMKTPTTSDKRQTSTDLNQPSQSQSPSQPSISPATDIAHTSPTLQQRPAITSAIRSATSPPVTQKYYLIQVASFRQHKDADRLRAELLLQGYQAQITSFSTHQANVWYRVEIGPVSSVIVAKQLQRKLEAQSLAGLIKAVG